MNPGGRCTCLGLSYPLPANLRDAHNPLHPSQPLLLLTELLLFLPTASFSLEAPAGMSQPLQPGQVSGAGEHLVTKCPGLPGWFLGEDTKPTHLRTKNVMCPDAPSSTLSLPMGSRQTERMTGSGLCRELLEGASGQVTLSAVSCPGGPCLSA